MRRKLVVVGCLALAGLLLGGCILFNKDPVAIFTYNQVEDTLTVRFDASGSYDPDGAIEQYNWVFPGSDAVQGKSASFTFPDNGSYQVKLEVIDDKGAVGCLEQSVQVSNPGPKIESLAVENLSYARYGQYFVCNWIKVTVKAYDPAGLVPTPITGGIRSVVIYTGDGRSFPGPTAQFYYKQGGQYTIRAVVTDTDGAEAVATKTIIVQECRLVSPVVSLKPTPSTVKVGKTVNFTIDAYDPDEHCDGCICCGVCPPPSPCPPPCPSPPTPCPCDEALNPECDGCPPSPSQSDGIVRYHTVIEKPSGAVIVKESRNFSVTFDELGVWEIRGIVWDDDCGCPKSTTFSHSIEVVP